MRSPADQGGGADSSTNVEVDDVVVVLCNAAPLLGKCSHRNVGGARCLDAESRLEPGGRILSEPTGHDCVVHDDTVVVHRAGGCHDRVRNGGLTLDRSKG